MGDKKPLDFVDNPDHVTLGLWSRFGGGTAILCMGGFVFNDNNCPTSAALAEVCCLLSAILIVLVT